MLFMVGFFFIQFNIVEFFYSPSFQLALPMKWILFRALPKFLLPNKIYSFWNLNDDDGTHIITKIVCIQYSIESPNMEKLNVKDQKAIFGTHTKKNYKIFKTQKKWISMIVIVVIWYFRYITSVITFILICSHFVLTVDKRFFFAYSIFGTSFH